jgi:hypothetical protein
LLPHATGLEVGSAVVLLDAVVEAGTVDVDVGLGVTTFVFVEVTVTRFLLVGGARLA